MAYECALADETLRIRFHPRLTLLAWLFYSLWLALLAIWFVTGLIPRDPVFAILLAVWVATFGTGAFRRETLVVEPNGLRFERGALFFNWSYSFPLSHVRDFRSEMEPDWHLLAWDRIWGSYGQRTLAFDTGSGTRRTGPTLNPDEAKEVAALVNQHLAKLKGMPSADPAPAGESV